VLHCSLQQTHPGLQSVGLIWDAVLYSSTSEPAELIQTYFRQGPEKRLKEMITITPMKWNYFKWQTNKLSTRPTYWENICCSRLRYQNSTETAVTSLMIWQQMLHCCLILINYCKLLWYYVDAQALCVNILMQINKYWQYYTLQLGLHRIWLFKSGRSVKSGRSLGSGRIWVPKSGRSRSQIWLELVFGSGHWSHNNTPVIVGLKSHQLYLLNKYCFYGTALLWLQEFQYLVGHNNGPI